MNALVPIALLGWIPVTVIMFALMPPRRAMIYSFMLGLLFLPMADIALPGIPDYDKYFAPSAGVLLCILLFDAGTLLAYRPRLIDLPIAIWCVVPMASSITNGLGMYDGLSASLSTVMMWGVPYLCGRLYIRDLRAVRELAVAILIGGLIYVPLCLYEVRMSPQLHRMTYGFHQHIFSQTYRFGGYRPTVFLQHGLMVGMWMTATSLTAIWLWRSKALTDFLKVPMWLVAGGLLVTAVLCRSLGALVLLGFGIGLLVSVRYFNTRLLIAVAVLMVPAYLTARIVFKWDGHQVVEMARMIEPDRADSLEGRLWNENLLIDKALQRQWLGWAGWGRSRVEDHRGRDMTTPDSQWIIAFGQHGLLGMISITCVTLVPAIVIARRIRARDWMHPEIAPATCLIALVVLSSFDNLVNAMVNPMFTLSAGALAGLWTAMQEQVAKRARAEPRRRQAAFPHSA